MYLFPGKTKQEVERQLFSEIIKKLRMALVIAGLFLIGAVAFWFAENKDTKIQAVTRPAPGKADTLQKIQIKEGEGWLEAALVISPQLLTEEELDQLHEKAEAYLDSVILADNESLQRIEEDLYFPEHLPDSFEISWSTDALWLLDGKGQVQNETLETETAVTITARIDYGTEFRLYERRGLVFPRKYTETELALGEIKQELESLEKSSRHQEKFVLPSELFGKKIRLSKERSLPVSVFLGSLAVLFPVAVYQGYFSELEKRKKRQKKQAEHGYTEFVTKLSLMLVAGVPVREAFSRLAKEYEKTHGENDVLTKELRVTCRELVNGCPEAVAYEMFGERFGLIPYQRMGSLLAQNTTKGVQNLRGLLLHEAKEVMAEERTRIKIRGEQAGTKLLLPMMGFLILIFAILLVPAFGMF